MGIQEICKKIDANLIVDTNDTITLGGVYAGDFLSRVVSKAPQNGIWVTIMNNINVAGVAVLADIKLIILAEDVVPSSELIDRLKQENIALLTTSKSVYDVCKVL